MPKPKLVSPQDHPAEEASSVETATPLTDPISELLAMEADLANRKASAIQTLLAQRDQVLSQLRTLGWEDEDPTPPRENRGGPAVGSERFCKICQINGHDARLHRGQDRKKKFTQAELDHILSNRKEA